MFPLAEDVKVGVGYLDILPETDSFLADLQAKTSPALNILQAEATKAGVVVSASFSGMGQTADEMGDSVVGAALKVTTGAGQAASASLDASVVASAAFDSIGHSATEAGQEVLAASGSFKVAQGAYASSSAAIFSTNVAAATSYEGLTQAVRQTTEAVHELTAAQAASRLVPPGPPARTDVGAAAGAAFTGAQGVLAASLLIFPTVGTALSGIIASLTLLTAGGLLAAVGAGIAYVSSAWSDLSKSGQAASNTLHNSIMGLRFDLFTAGQSIRQSLGQGAQSGISTIAADLAQVVQQATPFLDQLVAKFATAGKGFASAFLGAVPGGQSLFQQWAAIITNFLSGAGSGLLSFFLALQKPAMAFANGIISIIHNLTALGQRGLGLNTDQLTQFINNIFSFVDSLIQVVPEITSALDGVGLEISKVLVALEPIVQGAFNFAAAIKTYVISPILEMALAFTKVVLLAPGIRQVLEILGGAAIVAVAISKLSFGLLSVGAILKGQWIGAVLDAARALGAFVASAKALGVAEAIGIALPGVASAIAAVGTAAVSAAAALTAGAGGLTAIGVAGALVSPELLAVAAAVAAITYDLTEFHKIQQNLAENARQDAEKNAALAESIAIAAVKQKSLTAAQVASIQSVRGQAGATLGLAAYQNILTSALDRGAISTKQYDAFMKDAGLAVDSLHPKITSITDAAKGYADAIVAAANATQTSTLKGTQALQQFATATGQDFQTLQQQAVTAINTVGPNQTQAYEQFFTSIRGYIDQFKTQVASSFNFVAADFQTLSGQAHLTANAVISSLQKQVAAAQQYQRNWRILVQDNASKALLQQIQALGIGGAGVLAALVSGGKAAVAQASALVRQGGTLASNLADSMARSLGVAFQPILTAFAHIAADISHLPFKTIETQIKNALNGVSGAAKKTSDSVKQIGDSATTTKAKLAAISTQVQSTFGLSKSLADNVVQTNALNGRLQFLQDLLKVPNRVIVDHTDATKTIGNIEAGIFHIQALAKTPAKLDLYLNNSQAIAGLQPVTDRVTFIANILNQTYGFKMDTALALARTNILSGSIGKVAAILAKEYPFLLNTQGAQTSVNNLQSSLQSTVNQINSLNGSTINVSVFEHVHRGKQYGGLIMREQTGGVVPGSGSGDHVPILAEPGEFVIRKMVAQQNLGLLQSLNAGVQPTDVAPSQPGWRAQPQPTQSEDISGSLDKLALKVAVAVRNALNGTQVMLDGRRVGTLTANTLDASVLAEMSLAGMVSG